MEFRSMLDRLIEHAKQSRVAEVVTDAEHRVIYANPAFGVLSGYGRQKAAGGNLDEMLRRADVKPVDADYERSGVSPMAHPSTFSARHRRKDGSKFSAEVWQFPVSDPLSGKSFSVEILCEVGRGESIAGDRGFLEASASLMRAIVEEFTEISTAYGVQQRFPDFAARLEGLAQALDGGVEAPEVAPH